MDAKIVAMRDEVRFRQDGVHCPYCGSCNSPKDYVLAAELTITNAVGICPSCGGELLYEDFYDD